MKKKIEINNRKTAYVLLKDFCTYSMAQKDGFQHFLEVTEWTNKEGFDIYIEDVTGSKKISLTWGQMEALLKIYSEVFNLENESITHPRQS